MKLHSFLFCCGVAAPFILQPAGFAADKKPPPVSPAAPARMSVPEEILRNEFEWDTLRVPLPAPADIPWAGPFYNSKNYTEHPEAAMEVLPVWIRQSALQAPMKETPGHLHSLLELLKSSDPDLKYDTALTLYRLGCTNQKVMSVLKSGLDADGDRSDFDALLRPGEYISQREIILGYLRFYSDDSLIPYIESLLTRAKEKAPQGAVASELALYLEYRNRPQPEAFWLGQLHNREGVHLPGLRHALRILQKRPPRGFESTLAELFNKADNPLAKTLIAATAFELGYDEVDFESHLFQRAEVKLQAGPVPDGLVPALTALLHRNSARALEISKNMLRSDLHEVALRALAAAPPESALPLIQEYIEASPGLNRFPHEAFKALLAFDPKIGGPAWEKGKAVLLKAGHVETDFSRPEFYRRHRAVLE